MEAGNHITQGGSSMKKAYLVISIIAAITCLAGVFVLIPGIAERGLGGVNVGRVLFPLLISSGSFWLYKRKR